MAQAFILGGESIKPGERKKVQLRVAPLYDYTEMTMPVEVIRGKKEGPVLFISAAIHGDEINGVEIIRRLLTHKAIRRIRGTLIAVPIVNVFGFNDKSRYLPDRRDLNRSFPGSEGGSLAAQLANIFMKEIVEKCTHGIDLHTGAFHRKNYPQVRANLDDPETLKLAQAFGAPVIINSSMRDGSLREAGDQCKIPMLLYEGGECLRFDDKVTIIGLRGIFSVMYEIGMLSKKRNLPKKVREVCRVSSSYWVRAPHSGIYVAHKHLGNKVGSNGLLATISNPFGDHSIQVKAQKPGIIIGQSMLPLANRGDALFHVATFDELESAIEVVENLEGMDPVNLQEVEID